MVGHSSTVPLMYRLLRTTRSQKRLVDYNSAQKLHRIRKMALGKNDIIAVAYSHIKVNWLNRGVILGKGLKANKYEAAFGNDDEEGLDISKIELDDFDLDLEDEEEGDEGQEGNGYITLA